MIFCYILVITITKFLRSKNFMKTVTLLTKYLEVKFTVFLGLEYNN